MAGKNDFITPCWFRDRYGYKHKRLHWAWHKQWWAAFARGHRGTQMKFLQHPCTTTQADVEWAQKIADQLGLT